MNDLGDPCSYLVLETGTPVYSKDGEKIGELEHVLADEQLDVFDGILIDTTALAGAWRFADAAQIAEIHERGIVLSLNAADAHHLAEPSANPGAIAVHGAEDVDPSEFREKVRRAWEVLSGKGLDKP